MRRDFRGTLNTQTRGKKPAEQGFTLIEMAIVLAIIGLIVGGVLKGQEVVNNGRLKMQVAQMDAIKAAFYTFQDQYTFMPGDYPVSTTIGLTATTSDGDGNAIIGTKGTSTSTPSSAILGDASSTSGTESVLAWGHLAASNLLQGITLPTGSSLKDVATSTTLNYPGKMSGTFLWIATFSNSSASLTAPMIRLQLPITGALDSGTSGQAVREPDAYNIDRKYDDGSPYTGSILVDTASDSTHCAPSSVYTLGTTGGSPNTNYCTMLWVVQ